MKFITLLLALLVCGFSVAQEEEVYVKNEGANGAALPSAGEECNLEKYLDNKIYQAILISTPEAVLSLNESPPNDAGLLSYSISYGQGAASSAIVDGKKVSVQSVYKVGDQFVAAKTFISTRAFANFGKMCGNFEKEANVLAGQISSWLLEVRTRKEADSDKELKVDSIDVSDNTLYLVTPIEYADGNTIRDEIKAECGLPGQTQAYILGFADKERVSVKIVDSYKGKGSAMRVSIVDVVGFAGGMYTGEKAISMHVDLFKEGQLISGKDFERHTSMTSLFSGSCDIFRKLSRSFSAISLRWAVEQLSIKRENKQSKKSKKRKKIKESEKLESDPDLNKEE
jgi:hypothetical protein